MWGQRWCLMQCLINQAEAQTWWLSVSLLLNIFGNMMIACVLIHVLIYLSFCCIWNCCPKHEVFLISFLTLTAPFHSQFSDSIVDFIHSFFFGGWTQVLALTKQVLYHLSHSTRPLFILFFFLFLGFWDRVSLCSPGWLQIYDPPAPTSFVLGLQMCITVSVLDSFFKDNCSSQAW
jgi:hypothetical protein